MKTSGPAWRWIRQRLSRGKVIRLLSDHWVALLPALFAFYGVGRACVALAEKLGLPVLIAKLPKETRDGVLIWGIWPLLIGSLLTILMELYVRQQHWARCRVSYTAHAQGTGWMTRWVSDGRVAGDPGQNRRIEAIRIELGNEIPAGIGVTYQAHVQGIGWQGWKSNGEVAGTEHQSKRMEAIQIRLTGASPQYSVVYQVCPQGIGWTTWAADGEIAGTTGESRKLEAIRILVAGPGSGTPQPGTEDPDTV